MPLTDHERAETVDMLLRTANLLTDLECQAPWDTPTHVADLVACSPRGARHVTVLLAGSITHNMREWINSAREQSPPGFKVGAAFNVVNQHNHRLNLDDANPVAVVLGRLLQHTAESDLDAAYAALDEFLTHHAGVLGELLTVMVRVAHRELHGA